jgi:IMP dehydrogenase
MHRESDEFFEIMQGQRLALTFGDVRLRTNHSEEDFHGADITGRFSTHVLLKTPVVSAAMDRVTGKDMAIALPSLGGIGILHRNFSVEEQAKIVGRVKYHLNGKINQPVCVRYDQTVAQALAMLEKGRYAFRSLPVQDEEGRLVGILTGGDIDFSGNSTKLVSEVMTKSVITGDIETTVEMAYRLMQREKIKILPLIDDDGKVAGLYLWSDLKRILDKTGLHNVDANGQLVVGAAVGTGSEAVERARELVRKGVDVIVIDSAHGDSAPVFKTFEQIKQDAPNTDVVVGNISEYDSARRLAEVGVDGIKVGQGPGSICTTRIVAGVGTPQLTAIHNCAKAVRDLDLEIPICADGGIREPGDIPMAIVAGASSVMLGMMLAGTDESPGEVRTYRNRPVKSYRGMGSLGAMQDNIGSRTRYGERETDEKLILAEGVEGFVPYTGSLASNIHRLMEGLRRSMGYTGTMSLKELQEKGDFIRITNAGSFESHPHDIDIVES